MHCLHHGNVQERWQCESCGITGATAALNQQGLDPHACIARLMLHCFSQLTQQWCHWLYALHSHTLARALQPAVSFLSAIVGVCLPWVERPCNYVMVLQKNAIAVSGVVCLDVVHQVCAGVFWAFLDKHAQAIPQDRYHSIIQICPAQHTEMPPASEQAHHAGQWLSDYLIPCAAVNCIISCLCSPASGGSHVPQRGRCSPCSVGKTLQAFTQASD